MVPELKKTEWLDELMPFLEAVDEGYNPTERERQLLSRIAVLVCEYDSEIRAIPRSIRLLTNLQTLHLSGTQVSDLEPLSGLANLQELFLSYTQVSDLKPLSGLSNLQELFLSYTQVSDLEPLSGLSNLRILDLSYLPMLRSIPGWIGGFQNLEELRLYGLALDALPKDLLQLKLDFDAEFFGKGIHLRNTTLSRQPIRLFFQPREMIEEYFDAPKDAVNEAKVIFLGNGAAGKTYTVHRLQKGGEDKDIQTQTTHGIQITPISATKTDGNPFTVNCWDFGGQEIMHSMHRCFLTERTCYVVVVSNRENPNRQARYWLKTIEGFAKNAPVLLAVNRWDNILGAGIDMNRLVQEFSNLIPEPIYYQAKGGDAKEFNEKFTAAILRQAEKMDSVSLEFPEQWEAIRQDIRSKAAENRYISKADYHHICTKHGLENEDIRRWLLEWFNDLGVCFSYHQDGKKELDDYKVLDPAWLTNGIYILINAGREEAIDGKLRKKTIRRLLQSTEYGVLENAKYEENDPDYILAVMRKFKISFQVGKDQEFIPALCDEETPKNLHPENSNYHISYRIHYSYLPDNVIHRLMIEYHDELDTERLWRRGMCIGARHLKIQAIVELRDDTDLLIDVYSNGDVMPWSMLNELRKSVYQINKDMTLNAEDHVVFCQDGAIFSQSVSSLLDAREQGIAELLFYPETTRKWFRKSVNELLGMAMEASTLRSIEELAREKKIPCSQVIHNYGTIIMGDQNNTENYTESEELVKLVEKLIDNQADQNRDLLNKLVEALNGTGDSGAKTLATEMEQDFKGGKKNFLQKILDYLKPAGEIVGTTKTMAENLPKVMEAIGAVLKTVEIAAQVIF